MPDRPMRPLRICFLRSYMSANPNAIAHSINDLAAELAARGHQPFYLCLRPADPEAAPLGGAPERWPSRVAGPGKTRGTRLLRHVWLLVSGLRWLLKHPDQYDAVVTVDSPPGVGFVGWMVRRRHPSKAHVAWVLDLFYSQAALIADRPGLLLRTGRALEIRSLAAAQHVVVLGACMERFLRRETRVRRVSVVPIWPNRDLVEAGAAAPAAPTRQILYSGHAAARHPLTWLPEVDWAQHGYSVLVQGDGTEIEELARQLREAGGAGAEAVTVTGPAPRDQYVPRAQAATVHLVTLDPRASGTCVPSKTYAAMALGRPVLFVGDEQGQAPEDIRRAGAGLVIRDVATEAERLREFLGKSSAELDDVGAAGRDFVTRHRTAGHAAEAWIAVLTEECEQAASRPRTARPSPQR